MKKSIQSYLTPITEADLPAAREQSLRNGLHIVIDPAGALYTIELSAVREFNQSYVDKNTEHFDEKVAFINDYISFDFADFDYLLVDISDDTRPTESQLTVLFKCLKVIHKIEKRTLFAFSWRWTAGGGCSMYASGKQVGLCEKKLRRAIDEHLFKGIDSRYLYH